MLENGDFSAGVAGWENAVTTPGNATATFENKSTVYVIGNVGTQDWHIQLKQSGITLTQGSKYHQIGYVRPRARL